MNYAFLFTSLNCVLKTFAYNYSSCLYLFTGAIKSRFEGPAYDVTSAVEMVLLNATQGKPVPTVELQQLESHYVGDINFVRLLPQLQLLSNIDGARDVANMTQLICLLRRLGIQRSIFPDVVTLVRLYMCLPSTTASPERSFSTHRRLKTYFRSTMNQSRCYKERAGELDMKSILIQFIIKNDMRLKTFAMP